MAENKNTQESKAQTELEKKLKECFKSNPKVKKLYQTSDGQCFFKENDAYSHAATLADKEVTENDK
jgi:hypothetical protein